MDYKNADRTQWFVGIKPVHRGVYEEFIPGHPLFGTPGRFIYIFWNGEQFGSPARTPDEAFDNRHVPAVRQDRLWRGLAFRPEGFHA
jgi:prephenate dehydrogenase